MNKLNYIICLAFLLALATANSALAASCCDQTFTIYGKTQGDYSILLWDLFIGGECYSWYTHVFIFSPDTVRQFKAEYGKGSEGWAYDFIAHNSPEKIDTLKNDSGVYFISDDITVSPPQTDTTFEEKWHRLCDEYHSVVTWYKKCPINCIDYPVFSGCDTKLLYYYKDGLYKNYSLKEVYYLPESNVVIVLTHQPYVADGMDRMDGIIIYRIVPTQKGE